MLSTCPWNFFRPQSIHFNRRRLINTNLFELRLLKIGDNPGVQGNDGKQRLSLFST